MKTEENLDKIREFLDLVDNSKVILGAYKRPILVYDIVDDDVRYSVWEADMLATFGLKNVDGWDFVDSVFFCPDWMVGIDIDDD